MSPPFSKSHEEKTLVGVVGPCSAGKTTLITGMQQNGIQAKHIAQEHSFVKDMWEKITSPRYLIYLDVSYPVSMQRRPLDLSLHEFEDQKERLRHAREHADLYIMTDLLTPEDVLGQVLQFLKLDNPPNREYNATR